jgi:hypothetical protein
VAYGLVNADVIGTSVAGSNIGAGNASIMKNRIINGAMVIDQRNAGASLTIVSDNQYSLDRWAAGSDLSSKYSIQQNAGSVTPPVGFTKYLGITSLSSYSIISTSAYWLNQRIEGYNVADLAYGTASAKTVTLSAWVYSSLTGTFGGSFYNATGNYSYPFTYSIPVANTWTQISVTIAGDTAHALGTTNGIGLLVSFGLGVGSTYNGTAGSWQSGLLLSATGATSVVGTNGATFYITGVQLEVGSSATGFEYVNYQTSLANCQRYYEVIDGVYSTNYNGASNRNDITNLVWKVTKRTAPTLVLVSSVGATGTNSLSAGSGSNAVQSFYISGAGLLPTAVISGSSEL